MIFTNSVVKLTIIGYALRFLIRAIYHRFSTLRFRRFARNCGDEFHLAPAVGDGAKSTALAFISPGEKSFQLLRKVGENSPFQETRFVMALRFRIPERSGRAAFFRVGLNTALDMD
jgi:hypothetical protein